MYLRRKQTWHGPCSQAGTQTCGSLTRTLEEWPQPTIGIGPPPYSLYSYDVLFLFLIFKKDLFIYSCAGSLLLCGGFSLAVASGGYYLLQYKGSSWQWLLLLQSTGSRVCKQRL